MGSCIAGESSSYITRSQLEQARADVQHVQNVLTPGERQYLVKAADRSNTCKRSKVLRNGKSILSENRTSTSCYLKKGEDQVIRCIESKLASVANRPVKSLEALQVTKYSSNQQYKPHFDWFKGDHSGAKQRKTTLFVYLNEPQKLDKTNGSCGGATVFSRLKGEHGEPLRVLPREGEAVLFENLLADGSGNRYSEHGGEPVLDNCSQKIGLNAWFRDGEFV